MPSIEHRLDELLQRAEELRRRGEPVSAEELCRDCPELLMLFKAKLESEFGTKRRNDTSGPHQTPARSDSGPARSDGNDDLHIGSEPIPGYRLVLRLGRGGYGEVWKAVAPGGFTVALKFVPLATEGLQVEQRALDIIRTLRHPCLLTTVGSWQTNRYLVIAMELADRTLKDRFQEAIRQGYIGVPREELLEYFHEAAKGLDFLNEPRHHYDGQERVSFQHRDIKPENILLVGSGAKVADFGLVRLLEQAQTSHTGSMTPIYAAPEFFEGHTSQHSDQYSLAITYCHLRGGRVPFVGSLADVMRGHLKEPPDLSMLPPEERPIVSRALAKVPTQRWPNCAMFIAELRNCVIKRGAALAPASDLGVATYKPPTGSHITPAQPVPSRAPAAKNHPPKRRGLGLIVFGLLAACAVAAVAMNDSSKDFFKELFTEKKDKKSEEKKESTADTETLSNKASESKPVLVTATEKAPATPTTSTDASVAAGSATAGSVAGSITEKPQVESPKTKPTTAKLEAPALLDPNQSPETPRKDDAGKPPAASVPIAATTPNPTPTPAATANPTSTLPTPQPAPPALPEPATVPTATAAANPTPTPTQPTVASTSPREAPLPEPTTVRRPDAKPEPKTIAAAPATVVPREPPAPLKAPFPEAAAKTTQQAWAAFLGRPIVETNSIGMELTLIPAGEFTIGMDTSDVTRPPHAIPPQKAIIKSTFRIGTTEVTQGQWFQLMQTRPWSAHRIKNQDDLPASWISWTEANRFCALLTTLEQEKGLLGKNAQYQLPSESEWEWACRAGTVGKFSCPDGELAQYCWYENNTDEARPVRKLKPNPFGLFDMHGNAAEWCRDNFLNVGSSDPLTKGYLHGGNWKRTARHCASSARDPLAVDSQHAENGFRIMKTH